LLALGSIMCVYSNWTFKEAAMTHSHKHDNKSHVAQVSEPEGGAIPTRRRQRGCGTATRTNMTGGEVESLERKKNKNKKKLFILH